MLEEKKVLAEVSARLVEGAINVRWDNCVLKDGEVISRKPHRRSYGPDEQTQFLTDVPDGAAYIQAMGWS